MTVVPADREPALAHQVIHRFGEGASRQHVVRDAVSDPPTTWSAGARRHEPHGLHLLGPLVVVVAAAARLAKVCLPQVAHLVEIDRGGVIRLEHVGPITPEIWQRDILPLVRKLPG